MFDIDTTNYYNTYLTKKTYEKKSLYGFSFSITGIRINGHGKIRGIPGHGYESSSMLSSDLETTSFLESEDDASSRITSTTGRATNLSIDRMGTYKLSLFVLS